MHFIFIGLTIRLLDDAMPHQQEWPSPFKYWCSSSILLVLDFNTFKLPKREFSWARDFLGQFFWDA